MRGVLGIAIVWLSMAAPALAAAEPRAIAAETESLGNLQLVPGAGVAWSETRCLSLCVPQFPGMRSQTSVYAAPRAGGTPVLLARRTRATRSATESVSYGFSMSRSSFVLTRAESSTADGPASLYATTQYAHRFGPVGGVLVPVGSCGSMGGAGVAESGELVVEEICADGVTRLVVQGLDGRRRVLWSAGAPSVRIQSFDLRDGYVALVTGSPGYAGVISKPFRGILLRLADGAELRSLPDVADLTLGDRGDLLVHTGDRSCPAHVLRVGESEPLPVTVPCDVTPQLSGDRLWFVERRAGTPQRIVSQDFSGVRRTDVGSGATVASFMVDGRSLAWASPSCDGLLRVRVVPVGTMVGRPTSRSCPIRLRSRRLRVVRGRVRVELDCPRGCSAGLSLRRRGEDIASQSAPEFRQRARKARHAPELYDRQVLRAVQRGRRVRATLRLQRSEPVDAGRRRIDFPVVLYR